jgi:hypothetical protein
MLLGRLPENKKLSLTATTPSNSARPYGTAGAQERIKLLSRCVVATASVIKLSAIEKDRCRLTRYGPLDEIF